MKLGQSRCHRRSLSPRPPAPGGRPRARRQRPPHPAAL